MIKDIEITRNKIINNKLVEDNKNFIVPLNNKIVIFENEGDQSFEEDTGHIILYIITLPPYTRHRLLNKKRASVLDLPTISPLTIKHGPGRCTTLN